MRRTCLALLLALTPLASTADEPAALDGPGAPLKDELLDKLAGEWRVTGTVMGQPASQQLNAGWVLNPEGSPRF